MVNLKGRNAHTNDSTITKKKSGNPSLQRYTLPENKKKQDQHAPAHTSSQRSRQWQTKDKGLSKKP
jgi:hypothetical protein